MTEQRDNLPVTAAAEETVTAAETVTEAAVTAAEEVSRDVTETAVQAADDVKEAVAEAAAEATESSEETIGKAEEAVAEAAETVSEAAADAADKAAEAVTEAADKAADEAEEAAEEVTDKVSEAADKEDEAASTDHFKNIISAAEHSAEKTSQKLANFDDIFFKMPSDETELKDEENKTAEGDGSVSVYNVGAEGPMEEKPVIVFDHVHKEYEGQIEDSVALTDVSFSIRKGDFVFIVGPSGSGKSTMIRLMMREISPSAGQILIAGKNLAKLRKRQVSKYRRNIGIVFQDFRLLPDRSVYDNVAFAQRVVGAPKRNIPKEVSKVLHLVGLSQKYKSFPNELSGGEQQRVAIARALVNNPMIILADEPTGNLDPQNSYEIMSLLEEINRRGTTVVIVTHDREVVNRMQKRVVVLQEGTIVEDKRGGYNRG